MARIDFSTLSHIAVLNRTDKIQLFKIENSNNLSVAYTTNPQSLEGISSLVRADYLSEIQDKFYDLQKLSAETLTYNDLIEGFVSKTESKYILNQYLTKTKADTLSSGYIDKVSNTLETERQGILATVKQLCEEMTDFAAAAMVGINQTNSTDSISSGEEG